MNKTKTGILLLTAAAVIGAFSIASGGQAANTSEMAGMNAHMEHPSTASTAGSGTTASASDGSAQTGTSAHNHSMSGSGTPVVQASLPPGQSVHEIHLYAGDLMQEMAQGTTLYSWGYGLWDPVQNKPVTPPTVPGPELHFKEGEAVRIVFHNEQLELHTIHFHGIDNSFKGDGTPDLSQHAVEKGGTFTYEFTAPQAGTYYYHCHVETDIHPEMGLYGAIIVEPKAEGRKVDGEYTLILAERDPKLALNEATESGHYPGTAAEGLHLDVPYDTADRVARYYTINGKMDADIPPIKVKEGGTYLIRLINAGQEVHSIHTHGHHFEVVATDGRPLEHPYSKDTISISPGEKYEILLKADNPGVWPIHCHIGPHGTHGMHMLMVYEGYEEAAGAHHADPLGGVKHYMAAAKEQLFEKKAEGMAEAADGMKKESAALYNLLSLKNPDFLHEWEDAQQAWSDSIQAGNDWAAIKERTDALSELLAKLEQMLGGDMS